MAPKGNKRARTGKGKGQSSNPTLPYPPALELNENQQLRKVCLESHRSLQPSRWICRYTIGQLGIADTVQMLTERLGLWDFLCEEVNAYKAITIEFLSSYEFNRASRNMSFNLGGYHVSLHTTELLELLNLPADNVNQMRGRLGFYHDMNEHQFRHLTMHDILNDQRTKNISHPAIRYLQRVLSHTLFARGETASVFNEGDMSYVCSMLRRNNGEMEYMPHLTYNLAKHIKTIANNVQPGGIVRIGGVITKIARALNIPTGEDVIPGYTLVDLDGLGRARLIRWDNIADAWINLGVNNINHRLPLQTLLDPLNYATWKIVDPPMEEVAPPPPPVQPHAQLGAGQPQGDPTMQQMWAFMQTMQQSISNLHLDMGNRMDAFNTRMDTFDQRLDDIETHAAAGHHYARRGVMNDPNFEDDPPTPPHVRRAAIRREAEIAQQRAEAAAARAAQDAQEAEAAPQEEEGDEDEEEEEEDDDDMDADD
jgi:hypothetical protein